MTWFRVLISYEMCSKLSFVATSFWKFNLFAPPHARLDLFIKLPPIISILLARLIWSCFTWLRWLPWFCPFLLNGLSKLIAKLFWPFFCLFNGGKGASLSFLSDFGVEFVLRLMCGGLPFMTRFEPQNRECFTLENFFDC